MELASARLGGNQTLNEQELQERLDYVRRLGPFSRYGRPGAPEFAVRTPWGRVGLRFGRPEWFMFSEHYQGRHGIPRRFIYLLPRKVLTLTLRERSVPKDPHTGRNRW
jgi:hypothetical protein